MQIPSDKKDEATELAQLLYDHIEGQIGSADTKASFVLVANSLLASAITLSAKGLGTAMFDPRTTLEERLVAILTVPMLVAFLVSVLFAISVASPRAQSSRAWPNLYFFGYIARRSEDQFVTEFLKQTAQENTVALLASVYGKSRIADRKFTGVRRSFIAFVVAISLWAMIQMILAFTTA
jgi:Pycsar effector protein